MKDIAIYGAGGFGLEVACLINAINKSVIEWNLIGYFDDDLIQKGTQNEFGTILGGIDDLNAYEKPLAVVMAIGDPKIITKIISKINNSHINFPNIISPDVVFMDPDSFKIGKGNLIMFQSLISHNVRIGDFNFLNCGVSLGHGVVLGSFNSLMSYVKISGEVNVGNTNYFGVCSVVLQKKTIGSYTTIGTNSVIMRNTKENTTYFGNPAIEIRTPKI